MCTAVLRDPPFGKMTLSYLKRRARRDLGTCMKKRYADAFDLLVLVRFCLSYDGDHGVDGVDDGSAVLKHYSALRLMCDFDS